MITSQAVKIGVDQLTIPYLALLRRDHYTVSGIEHFDDLVADYECSAIELTNEST